LILVLAAIGGWAIAHKIFTDQLSATANPNRVHLYVVTLLYEWLLFVLVVVGVRRSGASALMVLGEHWHSGRQVLRDIGIAVGFWIVAVILLSIFGWLLRTAALGRNVSMLPHGGIELTLWIALSVTAGICEETIFRGYLQRQFMALTQSAPAGILLSAAAFGAAHAYQGLRVVIDGRIGEVYDARHVVSAAGIRIDGYASACRLDSCADSHWQARRLPRLLQ